MDTLFNLDAAPEPASLTIAELRVVTCPTCAAQPGSPCRRPSGHNVFGDDVHAARRALAARPEPEPEPEPASTSRRLRTALVRARTLTTRDELVRGGDGKPRTTHRLCEVGITATLVDVVIADTFERATFGPKDSVRVIERRRV